MEKRLLGQAIMTSYSNDLYWGFTHCDYDNNKFYHLKWRGYNDNYWWNNVCTQDNYNRKTVDEKVFEIDFNTYNVYEIIGE